MLDSRLEEVGEGDLEGAGLAFGQEGGGVCHQVELADLGTLAHRQVIGDAHLEGFFDDGTDTEVPAEGGGFLAPATLHGMTGGTAYARDDERLLAADIKPKLGTGEEEGMDDVAKGHAVTHIHRELEGATVDGLAILIVLGGCCTEVVEHGGIESQTGLGNGKDSGRTYQESWTDLVDILLIGIVGNGELTNVQTCRHTDLQLGAKGHRKKEEQKRKCYCFFHDFVS